jgi:hypothetical protein
MPYWRHDLIRSFLICSSSIFAHGDAAIEVVMPWRHDLTRWCLINVVKEGDPCRGAKDLSRFAADIAL